MNIPSASSAPPARDATAAPCVAFVGAGPGHPDLITLRGLDRLRRAECVVHDALVSPELLREAPAGADMLAAPRDEGVADPGAATGELLVALARSGRRVVRLKGGDPSIFGRLAEETAPLEAAGIDYEIVPGVTALLAAAAAARIPLTTRFGASHLTILTGHEAEAKPAAIDLAQIARLPGTLAVYMGMARMARWAADLVAAGRSPDTAVAVVSRCSRSDERVGHTTLGALAAGPPADAWPTPAVAVVGAVAALRDVMAAADAPAAPRPGPLAGKRVLLTRPEGQGEEMAAAIERLGGTCLRVPVVRIGPPPDTAALAACVGRADTFDWIVFASANGVRAFVEALSAAGRDARALGTARLAAIGPATSAALAAAGLVCDLEPATSNSEGMAAALLPTMRKGRVLLVRADRGRDVMRRELESAGHAVTEVAAYTTQPLPALDAAAEAAIDRGGVDWITVTSAAIAESAARLFGERVRGWRVASISPVTSAALGGLGIAADCEAAVPTAGALVEAIVAWERTAAGPAAVAR